MTNKERYETKVMAIAVLNYYNLSELKNMGIKLSENYKNWENDVAEWIEQEYEPSADEKLQAKLEEYTELETEDDMEEYKSCDNCKHEYVEPSKYPCSICKYGDGTEDNWNTDKPKNYIKEFMQDNGLNIGEEFEIDGIKERYHFSNDYILCSSLEFEVPNKFQCLLAGELKIKKLPKQEYVEVTNDVPRFTEIEVRDEDCEKWVKMLFAFKTNRMNDEYPYVVMDEGKRIVNCCKQARMLKPTEPQFEEGEMIEVSDDNKKWLTRPFVSLHNDMFVCERPSDINDLKHWEYARKIGG